MIRFSEMVLPGHPDKFCDQIADAVVAECYRADPEAYAQVEVAVWSDQLWLSGGVCTRQPIARSLEEIVREVGLAIGYRPDNAIDVDRYCISSTVCFRLGDPRQWTHHVNDQSIVCGWAGYDAATAWLPPEHYLAHCFREALTTACRSGVLAGQGPDGKLLLRMREEGSRWVLEHLLVTLQQQAAWSFMDFCALLAGVLEQAYEAVRTADPRWVAPWGSVAVLLNPNGPLLNGGSDGDNGQTGRKPVMDYYGPRVPLGGGALSGKDIAHVDRLGAYAAREAAVRAVRSGAKECLVRLAWAPNVGEPMAVVWEMEGRGERQPRHFFSHDRLRSVYDGRWVTADLARGRHFLDGDMPWNAAEAG